MVDWGTALRIAGFGFLGVFVSLGLLAAMIKLFKIVSMRHQTKERE
jgi:uncharacterized integral membrane protein